MIQTDEKEYMLQEQMKRIENQKANMTEVYLKLKAKYESMKQIEVDLRHEIYQLKTRHEQQKDSPVNMEISISAIEKRIGSIESTLSAQEKSLAFLQSQYKQHLEASLDKYNQIMTLLEELRNYRHDRNESANPIMVMVYAKNNGAYSPDFNRYGSGRELVIKMDEEKEKVEQIDEKEEIVSTEQESVSNLEDVNDLQEDENEVAALKEQIHALQEQLKEGEDKEVPETDASPSSQREPTQRSGINPERVTFRDIQNAENMYAISSKGTNTTTSMKRNVDHHLKNHTQSKPRINVNSGTTDQPFEEKNALGENEAKMKQSAPNTKAGTNAENPRNIQPAAQGGGPTKVEIHANNATRIEKEQSDSGEGSTLDDSQKQKMEQLNKARPSHSYSMNETTNEQVQSPVEKNESQSLPSRGNNTANTRESRRNNKEIEEYTKENKSFLHSLWNKLK